MLRCAAPEFKSWNDVLQVLRCAAPELKLWNDVLQYYGALHLNSIME